MRLNIVFILNEPVTCPLFNEHNRAILMFGQFSLSPCIYIRELEMNIPQGTFFWLSNLQYITHTVIYRKSAD